MAISRSVCMEKPVSKINMKAVVAKNLVKDLGDKKNPVHAVQKVSFEVEYGEIFGIIGPDGAGKTTLFRMLTTLLLPDGGTASVDGSDIVKDFEAIRNKVGYMPGRFSLYPDLTVAENLEFFATIFNTSIDENYSLVKDIYQQIEPFRDRRAGKLSGGMKQKLALSCALIHKPTVLFLDEPTTGVDAVSRKEFWDMLKNLRQKGMTILVSTPYMDEATWCDRIALMQDGKIMSVDTPAGIVSGFQKIICATRAAHMLAHLKELKKLKEVHDVYPYGEYHHVVFSNKANAQSVIDRFRDQDVEFLEVVPTIEDCFIDFMKAV